MLDLTKAVLPETVNVDGRDYPVQTNFKYWLRFSRLIADTNTPPQEFSFMFPYERPPSTLNGIAALIQFHSPPQSLPRMEGTGEGVRVLDYEVDADLIYAAFMQQYGIDLMESDMHWHKFLALTRGLKDTKLNEIISYRLYERKGKGDAYTKEMERLRKAWELPEEGGRDEALEEFEALLE